MDNQHLHVSIVYSKFILEKSKDIMKKVNLEWLYLIESLKVSDIRSTESIFLQKMYLSVKQ